MAESITDRYQTILQQLQMERERQKLIAKIESLEARYREEMRGRMVPTAKAIRIKDEIFVVKETVKAIDRRAAERLALEKIPIEETLGIIALPLLADVMNDLVAGVDGTLRRYGCQETVFGIYTTQMRKAALAMVDTLACTDENLPRLLDVDDTLVDAVRKKLMSFIRQRLKITKQK